MKTIITTLNSKYIHSSLGVRLLYTVSKDEFDVEFKEYTIKDELEIVSNELKEYDHVALGVYIWNVEKTIQLINMIKEKNPNCIITLGGPEVTYEPVEFLRNYSSIDYIISGEAEFEFKHLLGALVLRHPLHSKSISYRSEKDIISFREVATVDLEELIEYDSPYDLIEDTRNQIVYFESSRGCPYQCSYCLSSLETSVRFFSKDYVETEMLKLIQRGSRTIKFLDRTFNLKQDHAKNIFDFIINNHKENQVFQFEITGELLPIELIEYVNTHAPKNLFRFEIGIQSTNESTNELVKRFQNWDLLKTNIQTLQDAEVVDLHLDLIAGLPNEDLRSFKKTFNDVFSLYPHELQLGFLKMLRGTGLRNNASHFGYEYETHAPYEIIRSSVLPNEDLNVIKLCEEGLEKYWNTHYLPYTMGYLINQIESPFELFYSLGKYWNDNNYPFHRYQLDELFERLLIVFKDQVDEDILLSLLKIDYLTKSKVKPKRFWNILSKEVRNNYIRQDIELLDESLNHLYKYAIVEEISVDYNKLVENNNITKKDQRLYVIFDQNKRIVSI